MAGFGANIQRVKGGNGDINYGIMAIILDLLIVLTFTSRNLVRVVFFEWVWGTGSRNTAINLI